MILRNIKCYITWITFNTVVNASKLILFLEGFKNFNIYITSRPLDVKKFGPDITQQVSSIRLGNKYSPTTDKSNVLINFSHLSTQPISGSMGLCLHSLSFFTAHIHLLIQFMLYFMAWDYLSVIKMSSSALWSLWLNKKDRQDNYDLNFICYK